MVAIQKSTEQTQCRKRKASKLESLESSAAVASSSGGQSTIHEGFERLHRAGTDRAVAFMWYANGMSFNIARNAYARAAFKP